MNLNIGGGRYNIWKRNIKYKQEVIMLVKKNLVVDEVIYGEGSRDFEGGDEKVEEEGRETMQWYTFHQK